MPNKTKKKSKIVSQTVGFKKLKIRKSNFLLVVILVAIVGVYFIYKSFADASVQVNFPPVGIAGAGSNDGYWMAASDGGVFTQGNTSFLGSMGGQSLAAPVDGIVSEPAGSGYWLVSEDGGVFAFGSAKYYGGTPALANGNFNPALKGTVFDDGEIIVALIPTRDGGGYYLVSNYGRVWAYGDAANSGCGGLVIPGCDGSQPTWNGSDEPYIISATYDPSNNGFWLVSMFGNIYAYQGAPYEGGSPNVANIVGMASSSTGNGYWLVGSDGGVYAYGDANFYGSMGGQTLNAKVVGMAATSNGQGYWLAAADGGVFAFGNAQFEGRVSYTPPPPPPPSATPPTPSPTGSNTSSTVTPPSSSGGYNPQGVQAASTGSTQSLSPPPTNAPAPLALPPNMVPDTHSLYGQQLINKVDQQLGLGFLSSLNPGSSLSKNVETLNKGLPNVQTGTFNFTGNNTSSNSASSSPAYNSGGCLIRVCGPSI